jgi:hypothetical protein
MDQTEDPRITLSGLPVKLAGLAPPDPTVSAKPNYEGSLLVVGYLIAAMRGREKEFLTADYTGTIRTVKAEVRTRKKAKLESDLTSITPPNCLSILKGQFCEARKQANFSRLCHPRSTAPHFLLKSFAMLFKSAMRDLLEISGHIIVTAATEV